MFKWRRLSWQCVCSECYFCVFTLCCPPCPCSILRKVAFHPPRPPTYIFCAEGDTLKMHYNRIIGGQTERKSIVTPVSCNCRPFYLYHVSRLPFLTNRVACIEFLSYSVTGTPCIIHCNQNADDLGVIYEQMLDLAQSARCNIVAFDYCGYGSSSGSPSPNQIVDDTQLVVNYVRDQLKVPDELIVMFGMSIGSYPSTVISSRYRFGGLILLSSIQSGVKVTIPSRSSLPWFLKCFDKLRTIDYIEKVQCPVLFIHGKLDSKARYEDAVEMYKLCPNTVSPMWNDDADHEGCRSDKDLFNRIRKFLDEIASSRPSAGSPTPRESGSTPLSPARPSITNSPTRGQTPGRDSITSPTAALSPQVKPPSSS